MVFNINTTRFPSKISFRSSGMNYFWYFRLQVDDGIQSCCSFWSSLVYSLYRCVQGCTVQTVQYVPYRLYTPRTYCTVCTVQPVHTSVHTVQCVPYRLYSMYRTDCTHLYILYRTDCTVCTEFRKKRKNNGVMDLRKLQKSPNAIRNIF